MKENILSQLELIKKSNTWINTALDGGKQKNAYRNMVNCRRELNKKRFALESNPAAAIYGESQVGKSYLISSLLSEPSKPFSIVDENNVAHNFIEDINPPGGGNESTSLVSRFSVNYKPINPDYPVKATLLSPADIVLVLCDSFYNDIKANPDLILRTEKINLAVNTIKEKFLNNQIKQDVFGEDDVLDIQDYFRENLSSKATSVIHSSFFEEVSILVSKVEPNEWKDVFSLLWNNNEKFSNLFASLISEYEKLNFSNVVYLPLESVLYKHGTLLDVNRLKELYDKPNGVEPEYKPSTAVLLEDGTSNIVFPKSYLCALSAELVFCQQETLLETKPFLKKTDLLDFPGARSRMTLPENEINNENISELLLRGKVAYLFNKYSSFEKISIFILCAKHDQAAQRAMPEMLNNWVNKFIGDTAEKREQFVNVSKIPPLFIIGTFFNVNLAYNPIQDKEGNLSSLDYRWNQRFEKTLAGELLNTDTYQWFNNWTNSNKDFKNIFLLRDFVYSDSDVFKGFLKEGRELEEVHPENYPDFRKNLKQSFISNSFVKRHFENPENSWDRAAKRNEDGTKLIIDKLTIASENIFPARMAKMKTDLNDISQKILDELIKHFHSNDKDQELQKAQEIAGKIQHDLDTAFSADGIKLFGPLMKELLIDESEVLEMYRKKIDDIEHRDVVNMDKYSNYRVQVPVLEDDNAKLYFERLCVHYVKTTEEQKQQFQEEIDSKNIDLEELISGNSGLIRNNADQLAEALLEYWIEYVNLNDKHIIQQVLASEESSALQDVTEMYQKLFKKLGVASRISERIRHYVDGQNIREIPYEIIADISAELLNKFILSVGFEYFDKAYIDDLSQANINNKLGLVLRNELNPTEESVSELFEKIDNWKDIIQTNPKAMKTLPNYSNYLSWYNHLKIGFVSVCDIPNYDVAANENLGKIIDECETITY